MSVPSASDMFDVRSSLTDDELMVKDTVARFVDTKVLPIIRECFEAHRFPAELIPELAELGLLGCGLTGYGCAGLGSVAYGLVCQELERGDSSLRTLASVQGSLSMFPIREFGSEMQRSAWLPAMARGDVIGCFALTESHGGSDPGNMKTHAKLEGGDWILNGSKMWVSNGSIADVAVVWARTHESIRGFLVEKGMPGFVARRIDDKFSMRASDTAALYFDDVRVPPANALPGATSLGCALRCLTEARYGISWGAIGAAVACFDELLEYASTRVLFGRPLSHTQSIQIRFADMVRRITTARLLALQLGRLKEQGRMQPVQVSLAKWNNVRMALDVARDCRDMLGGAGISAEHGPIRHMLNLESVVTYEGTETVHELIVGRELTGVGAF